MAKKKQWFSGLLAGIFFTTMLSYVGCQAVKPPTDNPSTGVGNIHNNITQDTTALQGSTKQIKQDATDGKSKTPASAQADLDPYWIDILVQAGVQDSIISSLQAQSASFDAVQKQVTALQADDTAQKAQVVTLTNENKSAYTKLALVGFFLGLVGTGTGIGLMFSGFTGGKVIGVIAGSISVVCLVAGIVTRAVSEVNIYVVFGTVVVAIGGTIWYFIKHKTTTTTAVTAKLQAEADKAKLETQHLQLNHDFTNLQTQHKALLAQNAELTNEKAQLSSDKTNLAAEVKNFTTEVDPKIVDLQSKLEATTNRATALESRAGSLESKLESTTSRATALEARAGALETKVTAVDTKATSAETTANLVKSFVEGMTMGMNKSRDIWNVRAA